VRGKKKEVRRIKQKVRGKKQEVIREKKKKTSFCGRAQIHIFLLRSPYAYYQHTNSHLSTTLFKNYD